jgi:HEPN domain-containing protein
MDAQEKFEHWLDIANYDLESADAMYDSRRWLHTAFMCQQAIEKLAKGLYTLYIDDNVPRVHNITRIMTYFADKLPEPVSDERYRFFDTLVGFYIKGRYPEFRQKQSALMDEQEAKSLLTQTKEVFTWLKTLKP